MPYPTAVEGRTEINYRSAGRRADTADDVQLARTAIPPRRSIRAYAGDPLQIHVVGAPGGEQGHNLSLGGFSWPVDPFIAHSDEVHDLGFGPWETIDANVIGGAGGRNRGRRRLLLRRPAAAVHPGRHVGPDPGAGPGRRKGGSQTAGVSLMHASSG